MAKLWITELAYMPGMSQVAQLPPIAEQVVTFTTTTQSAAANHSTRFVRVISDADCHIAVGDNPTATTSMRPMMQATSVSPRAKAFGICT